MALQRAIIIIPTYNEKENIEKLVPTLQDVFASIKNWDMHILIVDDSSPDGTGETATAFTKKNKNVHTLLGGDKKGLGAAYLRGMKEAFGSLHADVIFEFDADFSHDPQKIPEFLRKIDAGSDFVIGSRYIKGGSIPQDWGWNRKFLSVVGNLVITVVFTDFRIHDWTGGYRAFTKKVYDSVGSEMSDPRFSGYAFQTGFLYKAVRKGFKVSEVPFDFVDRKLGKSKLGNEYIKNILVYIFTTRFDEFIHGHVFKFAIVGFIGFIISVAGSFLFAAVPAVQLLSANLIQSTGFQFLNSSFVATALATECAIISNFILNNFFTFADRKVISAKNALPKFAQFNFGSLGALIISSVVVGVGTSITGEHAISKLFWLVVATAMAMVVNYVIYSKFIWRKNK
ncbi:MAG TPA: glycosyltransferase family 2 protein [Patescibacteria group bacterium]|nr:glycosyltransferase family 2 protein [Patescibacteria group bacterium]